MRLLNRRTLFKAAGASLALAQLPGAIAQHKAADRVLILVEFKGGNDGLNTVVPFADPAYRTLRPRIALKDEEILKLTDRLGFHPALKPLMPSFEAKELAVMLGVGYPKPNLSHFRSIEIWETASKSDQYLEQGWITRSFGGPLRSQAQSWTAEGVMLGGTAMAALAGGARAIAVSNPEAFINQSRFATQHTSSGNKALDHILKTENDVLQAAQGLKGEKFAFKTEFPRNAFGNAVNAAAQVLGTQQKGRHIPVLLLTLGSFDTHVNQLGPHAALLASFAEGMVALKAALQELGRWESTLVLTYSEFGRRARENQSAGTDHGTAAPHFALGGSVKGGLYGEQPSLGDLDGGGNLKFTTDYRSVYQAVLQRWWGVSAVDSGKILGGSFDGLAFC